ncbi:site-2 protease family protein [Peptacetobacter hominis]|uniref:Site-2 protease family protein n=1 Tax=Peptacetobacter hominis TaxID=2743610 RepID=A0A544QTV6_9FIRM|nr:site-2 protease family protein [Peptacetobacter hominis]TQQ84136.1 site-2 protease family protein [Peptacetobacter hominis]
MAGFDIATILSTVVGIAVAISVHEFGHAYSAHLLGDDTAKMSGRMTLNPAKHVDPIGLFALIVFHIGWAKPVPVNPNNYRNYRTGNFIVSIAGVAFNIITAIICALIYRFSSMYAIETIAYTCIIYNIAFASFNLLPVPPLDGWGILQSFIPYEWNEYAYRFERISGFVFLALLITGAYRIFTGPIYSVFASIVSLFM